MTLIPVAFSTCSRNGPESRMSLAASSEGISPKRRTPSSYWASASPLASSLTPSTPATNLHLPRCVPIFPPPRPDGSPVPRRRVRRAASSRNRYSSASLPPSTVRLAPATRAGSSRVHSRPRARSPSGGGMPFRVSWRRITGQGTVVFPHPGRSKGVKSLPSRIFGLTWLAATYLLTRLVTRSTLMRIRPLFARCVPHRRPFGFTRGRPRDPKSGAGRAQTKRSLWRAQPDVDRHAGGWPFPLPPKQTP